jgi:rhodanese-related sulfurtransferase
MPTVIQRAFVQTMLDEGAQLLDALAAQEYAEEHIVGAANVPLAVLSGTTTTHLDRNRPIVVYCHDTD